MGTIIEKIKDLTGAQQGTAGPIKDANSGMREARPYRARYNNGIIVGHDNSMMKFYKAPKDVQVDFVDDSSMIANQIFFVDLCNKIGQRIQNNSKSKTRGDERVKFHISMSKENSNSVETFEGISPSHEDFIERIAVDNNLGKPLVKPVWRVYIGFEVKTGDITADAYGAMEKAAVWLENFRDENKRFLTLYRPYLEFLDRIANDAGLQELSFSEDPVDEQLLTAWFGEDETSRGQKRAPETTHLSVFKHGQSIVTPRWGEVTMKSIKPQDPDLLGVVDPVDSMDAKFAKVILHPKNDIVHVSIRGEIRAPKTVSDIVDAKQTSAITQSESSSKGQEQSANIDTKLGLADLAISAAVSGGMSLLDNVEMTVASKVYENSEDTLNSDLSGYGLEAVIVEGRQHRALCTTIPGYPSTIYKIPAGNISRNPNTMQFYAGIIAMSGLFGSIKPCSQSGVYIGLSQSNHDLKEIYSGVCDGKAPVKGIFGTTGSGKAIPLATKVLTPKGWQTMGSLKPGDEVYGMDGAPAEIVSKSEVYRDHSLSTFVLDYEQSVTSDGNHQWIVVDSRGREAVEAYLRGESSQWLSEDEKDAMGRMVGYYGKNAVRERMRQRLSAPGDYVRMSTDEIIAARNNGAKISIPFAEPADFPDDHYYPDIDAVLFGAAEVETGAIWQRMELMGEAAAVLGRVVSGSMWFSADVPDSIVRLARSLGATAQRSDGGDYLMKFPFDIKDSFGEVLEGNRPDSREIIDVRHADTVPVQCMTVDNESRSFVIEGYIPTSNTVQALMEMNQVARSGIPVFFLNPKPNGASPEEMFKMLDGVIIKMDRDFLKNNPGLLDPVYYMDDPEDVADILVEMILEGLAMKSEMNKNAIIERSSLKHELMTNARMPENKCSWDIIAGNKKYNTPRLKNSDIVDFVRVQREISPFWLSTISHDRTGSNVLRDRIRSGKPVYIEWGSGMAMPSSSNQANWDDNERQAVRSVVNLFKYAVSVSVANGKGLVAIDEAHNLRASEQAMSMILKAAKEWRAAGLELWLMTQRLEELVQTRSNRGSNKGIIDITDSISQFMIMAIEEESTDVEIFYDLTKLPRTEENTRFITTGKPPTDPNKIALPTGYYINRSDDTNWSGGIICGPWPRTDFLAAIGKAKVNEKRSRGYGFRGAPSVREDIDTILNENRLSDG